MTGASLLSYVPILNIKVQRLRFWQRCCQRFKFSGILRRQHEGSLQFALFLVAVIVPFMYTYSYIDHCIPGVFSTLTIRLDCYIKYHGGRGSSWSALYVVRSLGVVYLDKVNRIILQRVQHGCLFLCPTVSCRFYTDSFLFISSKAMVS
jgi:hypothetical protein